MIAVSTGISDFYTVTVITPQLFDARKNAGSTTGNARSERTMIIKENTAGSNTTNSIGFSSDIPIKAPTQDIYGIDGFARSIATTIAKADASEGLVLAVNGPWGSGKSSACNLILHHLTTEIEAGSITTVTFNPWWFSGAEALTVSFFQELRAEIGKTLPEQAQEALATLGTRLSTTGPLLGSIAAMVATPAAGAATTAAANVIGKLTNVSETVEQQHSKLSKALRDQNKKFLIVIDDIDRLSTDDALQIFRLIKSVGQLPNIIYLLAFDKVLADKMVAERFPSEGPSYLEKVIQGAFELPLPSTTSLRDSVLRAVEEVMGTPEEAKLVRFMNLFYEVSAPLIQTPRDTVRLSNALRVTWPAVREEVDKADFLALESLRLFLPSVHAAIKANPDMLCGAQTQTNSNDANLAKEYEDTFLGKVAGLNHEVARRALLRLFPRVQAIWSNTYYSSTDQWQRERLVCSEQHFPTYFSFSVNEDTISTVELKELLDAAGDSEAIVQIFRKLVKQNRRDGGTRAALGLEELLVHAPDIDDESVPHLLAGLFVVADEIDVKADTSRGFAIRDNSLRIHWLINVILRDRFDLQRRSQIMDSAATTASLAWLESISSRCKREHEPDSKTHSSGDETIVTLEIAEKLRTLCLDRMRMASENEHYSIIETWFHCFIVGAISQAMKKYANGQTGTSRMITSLFVCRSNSFKKHGRRGLDSLDWVT